MYEIITEASFSAAHRLREYNGPCEHLHGHNWLVRAVIRCETLDHRGIGMDFHTLRSRLNTVLQELDHKDLNAVFDPLDINPSSENIARWVFGRLQGLLDGGPGRVGRVEVFETPGNCAAYFE